MPDRSVPAPARWVIDPHYSHVGFAVRRRGLATLRARFTSVSGHVDVADDQPGSSLELVIVTSSVDSGTPGCDLRSAEHLDVARHPTATFRAAALGWTRGHARFHGRLTIVGVVNEVDVDVDFRGIVVDPSGTPRSRFSGTGSIDREAWGLTWNITLADGRALVERIVDVEFELESVRQRGASAPITSSDTGRH